MARIPLNISKGLITPILGVFLLFCALISTQPGAQIDRIWSDVILKSHNSAAPADYLIVNVSIEDQKEYGSLPLSRATIADVLNTLEQGNAERVLLDMILLEEMESPYDSKLVSAMEELGPDRLAIAHAEQMPDSIFHPHSALIDMRLQADSDGWTRHVGSSAADRGFNPSYWLATGDLRSARIKLDQRFDPKTVERMSISELMRSPNDVLDGRRVIFSQNPIVASSRIRIPLMPTSDRALAIVLGAASITNNHAADVRRSQWAGLAVTLLCLLLGCKLGISAPHWLRLVLISAVLIFGLIWTNMFLMSAWGGHSHPILQFSGFLLGLFAALMHRLKLIELISGFMKGDLSPEEAWAWRSLQESRHPVILLSGMGQVRRINAAANTLTPLLSPEFAKDCLVQHANNSGELQLLDPVGNVRVFALSWPNPAIPIVIMKDVTEDHERFATLQKQINTDSLTGLANRAGLDRALQELESSLQHQDYDLMYMDMNGFKSVNDTHGHDAGDQLLKIVAGRLRDIAAAGDVIARLGGDEFAILHYGKRTSDEVAKVVDKIDAAITQTITLTQATVTVGIAIGCAAPEFPKEPTTSVLNRADQLMYARKSEQKRRAA